MAKYVIVGNSAGGIGAVEAIREVDPQASLAMVSDEPYAAYSRPAIAEFLMGERDFGERMLYRDPEFYRRNRVEEHFGVRVTQLDVDRREAILDTGERLGWERLLLATGGVPIMPRMDGLGLEGVHAFTTIDHARSIDNALRQGANRVVVIGGGLIGCSLTHALVRRGGVEVVMVELLDRVLAAMMDATASRVVEARLRDLGVRVITGHSVVSILPSSSDASKVGAVTLDNGEEVPCDLVGVGVGVAPRVELARETPIQVNRGIVVDRHMETTVPGVFACGDVAEAYDFIYGSHRVVAIWPNAYFGGRIAGFNMAGASHEYDGCTSMNAFSYFDLALASAGLFDPGSAEQVQTITAGSDGAYKKVVLRDGRVVGFLLLGEIEPAGVLFHLMRDRTLVGEFQDLLLEDGFGLAALPRPLRDAWLQNGNGSGDGLAEGLAGLGAQPGSLPGSED
ncbi:MAG: FAD-dependent oxidoreductase [Dehalococcoidia bacterium]